MADQTFYGAGGLIYRAPANTALPSFQSGALPTDTQLTTAGFTEIGTVSDAGLQFTPSRDSKEIQDWHGNVKRTIYTAHSEEFKFSLIDFVKDVVLKAAYGDTNVTTTAAATGHGKVSKVVFNESINTAAAYVFLMTDGNKIVMYYAPQCEISGWEAIAFTKDDVAKHALTAKATKGTSANTLEMYADDGEKTA